MSDSTDSSAPKIIVDSDWKEQVAKEKEMAAKQEAAAAEPGTAPSSPSTSANASGDGNAEPGDLPPPGLEHVVSVFFTQALMFLGQMPSDENSDQMPPVNKPMAKHVIDTLEVLDEKTKGNTTDDESKMLQNVLHALRMAYVNTR